MGIKLSVVSSCNTSSDMSICDWVLEIGGNDIEWLFNSVCLKEGGLVLVGNSSIFMRLRSGVQDWLLEEGLTCCCRRRKTLLKEIQGYKRNKSSI